MDKWDEITDRVKNGLLAEEPEAALSGALELFANFGRVLELISEDLDRIASAIENKPQAIDDPNQPGFDL